MLMNVYWLTRHYFVPPAVVPTGFWRAYGFDFVLIDGDGRSALATCGTTDPPVINDVRLGLDVEQLFVDAMRDLGLDRGRVGLAGSEVMPWTIAERLRREFPELQLVPADLLMAQVRFTLSHAECDMVRQAVAAGCRTLEAGLQAAVPGASDGAIVAAGWQVAARTQRQQHWNFIAASGPIAGEYAAGSLPSWDPVRPYERGDLIHPDCYGYVDGYMYDVQRTMVVGARPTPRQQWLIDGSWDHAQALGEALRDGVTCRDLYRLGVRFMADRGYGGRESARQSWEMAGHFGHGYASGFDWPWLGETGPLVDLPLKAPYAVTIELYWQEPGVGQAWVEENWLVLPDRSERLSGVLPKTYGPDGEPIWS
jgi:Xaa-Pro aminopeptidase